MSSCTDPPADSKLQALFTRNATGRTTLRLYKAACRKRLQATVYFRNSSGCFRESENADFLNGHGVSVEDQRIVVLNSRHTDVESFCWDVVESITDEVTVNFEIQSFLNWKHPLLFLK